MKNFKLFLFTIFRGFDNATGRHEIQVSVKQIILLGDYTISGSVLILPIQGEGKCNLTLDNVEALVKFIPQKFAKNKNEYIKTQKYKFTFSTTRLHMRFENLYRGDKVLGDSTNLFLNENWEDIFNDIKPKLFETFGEIFEQIINSVFSIYPHEEFFKQ